MHFDECDFPWNGVTTKIFGTANPFLTTRTLPEGFSSSDFLGGLLESCFGSRAATAVAEGVGSAEAAVAAEGDVAADTAGVCLSNSLTFADAAMPQAWKKIRSDELGFGCGSSG